MSPKRILCVEDLPDDCSLISGFLDSNKYAVTFANTINDAIAKARAEAFDLYLLDVRLEDGSGLDLAKRIRSFDQNTPLVFHSESATAWHIEEALKAGANSYITKPSDPDIVRATIRQLTSAHR